MANETEKTEKNEIKALQEKLFSQNKHAGQRMTEQELADCNVFCEDYKSFMNLAKTEREANAFVIAELEKFGYQPFTPGMELRAGDRIYLNNRGKSVILATIGTEDIRKGVRLCAAHIDSPRLDLKQHPVYEDAEMGYFKTHYYGGIKKYQWTAIPLSLHGVIIRKDGSKLTVRIGEDASEPVFYITDLLPHLADDQMRRTLAQGIKGEELNIVIGSMPFRSDEGSNLVKLQILNILHQKYAITEDDFISAELEAVPAFPARDVGFDRSMIGAYGHDDRVCAYPAFRASLDVPAPKHTSVVILTDKEETGSDGNTGLKSAYLKYFLCDLAECFGANGRTVMSASKCLSADVNAGFDATFPDVLERKNCAYLNHGVCVTKFTGARGKSGTSDASAEFVGEIRNLLDSQNVIWQTGELGKVDVGGGGTVAAYIANLNIDTIDIGVPVLSMHSPYELVAKTDVWAAYRAFRVFLES
ncbi:MAG: aminopeptidase [Oscillospiraceae bacterium]|nr:aminopeptidase [Oscillospiraceae bacterium]